MTMTSQSSDMMSSSFFLRCCVWIVKFRYRPKFHVNIITGSTIMTIFLGKGSTRNPDIGNTPVWFLPNMWRLVYNSPNLAQMSLMKCYWMLENTRITAFTVSVLLKEPQLSGKTTPHPDWGYTNIIKYLW